MTGSWTLSPDRCFSAEVSQRACARELYALVKDAPIISPHGHVDPALLADPAASFGTPTDLFIIPDHYVFRMLYSQGIALEGLGIPTRDGTPVEQDHRRIWQRFADHFYLFSGTPTGLWLADELTSVFGVTEKLSGANAQAVYDHIASRLAQRAFTPRALLARFKIDQLCTTDAATSRLDQHRAMSAEDLGSRIRPTFRPDAVVNLDTPGWLEHTNRLSEVSGIDVKDYRSFIQALEARRATFKELGATATDHAVVTPFTERLSEHDADKFYQRALRGSLQADDAHRFTGHMMLELARMSTEDGLVMQLHAGSCRNHNPVIFERFGPDMGADIPLQTEWTQNLRPLLEQSGNDPRFRLILFTLDETAYSRELAPIAGHYPSVFLGPPWWFLDSVNAMHRFLESAVETAGLYNLAGFNDDTRAFCSIPARHDMWRRVSCNWLAGKVVLGLIDQEDAGQMAMECAYGLAQRAYRLE
ncbi:MAG: uxaC [Chloroflexi bacterium]|nr:uxaC [Chloroflexota bacterium]